MAEAATETAGGVADLLRLSQWLSPAFPLGAFAWSHGLEAAIAAGQVADAAALESWLADVLRFGAGQSDAALLVLAMTGAAPVADLAALAVALAASRERHEETLAQGAAFVRTVNALTGGDLPAMALPVAVGAAAADMALSPEIVAALYLQGFAGNLVTVAVRFVPLGQTEGQAVLARLRPVIAEVAQRAVQEGQGAIGTAAFGADLAAMQHEAMEVRLFRS
ncbi:urease accessory protein UreF [Tropicimonas sp. IMCC34043]|uniref:urease accessory protein UreF n=1 Tax=Tropicimonas sp. IMCC34043 TaxID=2248760 RepID=UPI000E2430E3|nr:urease accessory UreF family protein [Tropicimonas sp. IMCC34043]